MIAMFVVLYRMLLVLLRHLSVMSKYIACAVGLDDQNMDEPEPQVSELRTTISCLDQTFIQDIETTKAQTLNASSTANTTSIDTALLTLKAMDKSVPHVYRHFNKLATCAKILIEWSTSAVHSVCIDTGSCISIIDYDYVRKEVPNAKINVGSTIHPRRFKSNTRLGQAQDECR
jgi:hypothetical protein